MKIDYRTRQLQRTCTDIITARKKLGEDMAKRLFQRQNEISAMPNLAMLRKLPGPRLHELKGKKKGQFAVDLIHPKRLLFEPDEDPPPLRPDGGIDLTAVKGVLLIGIIDYH